MGSNLKQTPSLGSFRVRIPTLGKTGYNSFMIWSKQHRTPKGNNYEGKDAFRKKIEGRAQQVFEGTAHQGVGSVSSR